MWTNEYIHIPFKELGRDRDGSDCWGLVRIVYKERLGIELPTLLDYKDTRDKVKVPERIIQEASRWVEVEKGSEMPYDVAVFRMAGFPMHVGLVVEKNIMLHCERGSGTYVCNYMKEQQWYRRLIGFYRYADSSNSPPPLQFEA